MPIKGLSEKRRLPRAGKIGLGITVKPAGVGKPYPKATEHFVCPIEVQKVYGERPTRLSILFPSDDMEILFPQELKLYRTSGLWCRGDGERAHRWNELGGLTEMACPCQFLESGECRRNATLNFFLPDVPGVGIYQVVTGSKKSITSINTCLETFRRMFGGLAGIPFDLLLEPQASQRFDEKKGQMVKRTEYVLRLDSPYTLREILEWRSKAGKPVEALMPAPEAEPEDVEPEEEAEPEPTHGGATSEIRTESPTPPEDLGEFDISLAFAAAGKLGVTPTAYTLYLKGRYGADVDNLPVSALAEQRELFAGTADSKIAESVKAAILMGANKASKQGRLL